ncbi:unnamed protein product (macronuclear) [Paramecium tetraurelia]|uniref:Chromosome undetermined scaffold_3, whole genome shotgun sequence n=1 Tax=Paramecium tetraurelia TaxID=5888 RepID=Q3SE49_PARTE|nr:uncharacterized protein GSPATT00001395001 [Paramecium tetraurelia]CAI39076.1 PAZ and PIWI domain protein [Paramecium tetraurelia]CAK75192.1 unnamed protein product [Paramecium tetraurelia]|eukprot:XP_001442589.1 hypothetical protein (macronuclear) [Paramecium tetraurelia strain d4-2]
MNQRTQEIQLKTNYHEISLLAGRPIYEYELEIINSTPELIQAAFRQYRPQILQLLTNYMSIDNKIYSPKIIDGIEKTRSNHLGTLQNQEEAEQIVSIKFINRLSENHISKNQIIARLIKQVVRNQFQMVSIGKTGSKLFWNSKTIKQQENNLEIWPGVECIYQPSAFQNFKPKLIIDCAFKILRYRTALEELDSLKPHTELIIGQIVMTTYNKKFYQISGLEIGMNPKSTFQNQNGEAITFESYYSTKYNQKIIPNQPLLKAIVTGKKDESQKEIYLIPSLCQMTGLTDEMRNNFNAMKKISEITKPSADTRMRTAQDFIQQLQATKIINKKENTSKEVLKEWGLEIKKDCIQVQAQRLDPGNMLMGRDLKLNLRDSNTNLERQTQTQMFYTPPQKLITGIIYNSKFGQQNLKSFLQHFKSACQEFQFDAFLTPKAKEMQNDKEDELSRQLRDLKLEADQNQSRVNFLIFLLPGQKKKARLYKACKVISMATFGCASQVIVEKTLQRNTRSIVNKILIQLNAKIGGTPWALDGMPDMFTNQPTMICGVDIFTKAGRKSQLAFCSTINRQFSRYYSQVITSGEFCSHLQLCLKAALLAFKQELSVYPKNVIIYRDGVGDGQQVAVLGTELPQYKQALKELELKDVSITLVICNKRVSAKFYSGGQGRAENPPPGTVIDNKIITNEEAIKFYLISQLSRQGTVTPTLYKVLYSDLQGIEQTIKILTFKLCWLYYNFTGSIKIPAPVRYAHCLCNFIGDNYDDRDQMKFLPQSDLIHQKVLFYI